MALAGRRMILNHLVCRNNNNQLILLTKGQNTSKSIGEVNLRCFSSSNGKLGGRFRFKFLNSMERLADRLYSRWLYLRYDGNLGPQPKSFTVKQKRIGYFTNFIILFLLGVIYVVGKTFDPLNQSPIYVGVKIWPDNMEEYKDLLDAKYERR